MEQSLVWCPSGNIRVGMRRGHLLPEYGEIVGLIGHRYEDGLWVRKPRSLIKSWGQKNAWMPGSESWQNPLQNRWLAVSTFLGRTWEALTMSSDAFFASSAVSDNYDT